MRLRKNDEGSFVRIRFEDVGVCDALLVEVDKQNNRAKVYDMRGGLSSIEQDQVVTVGPFVNVPIF